jgi:2',3'-cyclic-nucleotide 2'-phosphodiesterase (5'-nucleotidase family)
MVIATVGLAACLRARSEDRGAPVEIARDEPKAVVAAEAEPIAAPIERPIDRCGAAVAPPAPRPELATCAGGKTNQQVTILHVGDLHAHFQPDANGRSPFAILRAHADRRRRETGGALLFVDAGDALEKGSLADARSEGDATIHLLDRLGLDLRTLGNHDFAWGLPAVLRQIASPSHDVLASNVRPVRDGIDWRAKRYVIKEVGCAKIGLFGLLTEPYDETDERVDAPYFGLLEATHDLGAPGRYVDTARALVRELREVEGVHAVIAVDHLGMARDRALIDAVAGLDLVISGHDHLAIGGAIYGRHGAIVASGSPLTGPARVGEVVLEVDLVGRRARPSAATLRRIAELDDLDPAVQAEVERVIDCFVPEGDRPIADLAAPMGSGAIDVWSAIVDEGVRMRWPDVRAIFYEGWSRGGPLKGDLPAGPVTAQALADLAWPERQMPGTPGFTALEPIEIDGATLRTLCRVPLRPNAAGERLHRVCPPPDAIDVGARHRIAIERRPLHAPARAFVSVPEGFPAPPPRSNAVEIVDLLLDVAKARGRACRALDRDQPSPCRLPPAD